MLSSLLLLWLATPLGLRGLAVDSNLHLQSGSDLPSQLEPGDRVVAVNEKPVHSRRELAAVLARSPFPTIEVVVELRDRMRTVTLSQLRMENDPPAELLSAARIVRVDTEVIEGAMPVSELHEYLERAAPTPIEVEYELERAQVGGPVSVQQRTHSPIVLAWLALGLLGMIGVALLRSQRLSRSGSIALPISSIGIGALAMAALTANVVSVGITPSFALWAVALAVAWRSAEAASRVSRVDSPVASLLLGAPALLAVAGAGLVSVTSLGEDNVAAWLGQVDQFVLAAGALALAFYGGIAWRFASEERRVRLAEIVGVAVAIIGTLVVFLATEQELSSAVTWGLLLGGGVIWPTDLAGCLESLGSSHAAAGARAGGRGLAVGLTNLVDEVADSYQVYGFVGIGEDFVSVSVDDPTGTGEMRVVTAEAKPEVAAALSMLALEGGMYPRPMQLGDADEDPFSELRARLGFEAIVPVGTEEGRAGVQTFVGALGKDASAYDMFPVESFVESVQSAAGSAFVSELVAVGSEALLRSARRALRESQSGTGVSSPVRVKRTTQATPAPAPSSEQPGSASAGSPDTRWVTHLTDQLGRAYPVDEPAALDDREWLALSFLRDSIQPALIIGEAATGKEFVARAVHEAMWGADRRFATVDCATRPPSIVDVELFGDDEEPGLVDVIGKGTLLLKGASTLGDDRLANLVPRLCRTSCRLIFAERYRGNEDGVPATVPKTIVRFCGDRHIHLSPLRERASDIPRFANHFLHEAAMRYGAMVTGFEPDALEYVGSLELSGNFLELRARVTAAVLRSDGETISRADFGESAPGSPPVRRAPEPEQSAQTTLALPWIESSSDAQSGEKDRIVAALEEAGGNRTRAAEVLGFTRGKLLRRLKKYNLS